MPPLMLVGPGVLLLQALGWLRSHATMPLLAAVASWKTAFDDVEASV